MPEAVLDTSALLAFLRNEPGASRVAAVLSRACISAVNLAEVLGKMVGYGKPLDAVAYQVERLRIPVIPFDAEQATFAASLWKATRSVGLLVRFLLVLLGIDCGWLRSWIRCIRCRSGLVCSLLLQRS